MDRRSIRLDPMTEAGLRLKLAASVPLYRGDVGLGSYATDVAQFRALDRSARDLYLAGQRQVAEAQYAQAKLLAMQIGDPTLQEDLGYTRKILDGDQGAISSYGAGRTLVATGDKNSKPNSVWDSFWKTFKKESGDALTLETIPTWAKVGGAAAIVLLVASKLR